MIDRVAGELYADLEEPRDQPGDWREAVRFIARRNWEAFLKHPWLLSVADGRPVLGPNISRKYEAELRPLDGIGLSDLEMDSVLTLVLVHVEGLARWQWRCSPCAPRAASPTPTGGPSSSLRWWR